MILTGDEIKKRIALEEITIEGFKEEHLNPNSYDLTLGDTLTVYNEPIVDVKKDNTSQKFAIPDSGYILRPGELYLAHTVEKTTSKGLVPKLYGKSSSARLGLNATCGAGYGDTGFSGQWTLAITVARPTKIYKGMKIVQIEFSEVIGELTTYNGKYQNSVGAVTSGSFKDIK